MTRVLSLAPCQTYRDLIAAVKYDQSSVSQMKEEEDRFFVEYLQEQRRKYLLNPNTSLGWQVVEERLREEWSKRWTCPKYQELRMVKDCDDCRDRVMRLASKVWLGEKALDFIELSYDDLLVQYSDAAHREGTAEQLRLHLGDAIADLIDTVSQEGRKENEFMEAVWRCTKTTIDEWQSRQVSRETDPFLNKIINEPLGSISFRIGLLEMIKREFDRTKDH